MSSKRRRWHRLVVPAARLYGHALGTMIAGLHRLLGERARPLGPGPMLGVLVGSHIALVGIWIGPLGVLAGLVAGAVTTLVTALSTHHRGLDEAELQVARQVFGDADWLPRVVLTDLDGVADRAFTMPGIDGRIYCNLGKAFADPLGPGTGAYPASGQLLVHELVHAWQISRASSPAAFLADALAVQARYSLGEDVYGVRGLLDPGATADNGATADEATADNGATADDEITAFADSTLEQQATLVDRWFAGRDSPTRTPMDPDAPAASVIAHLIAADGPPRKSL